jgi:fucose permease
MAQWLPAFAERSMNFSKSAGAAALTGFLAAMWLGRVLAASLGHRVSSGALLAASAVLSAALYVAGVYVPSRELALAACVATGLAVGTLWPTTLGLAADRIPRGGATMFGMLSAAGNAGCLAAPWLVGVVADRAGLRAGLVSCAVFPVIMILALAAMKRAGRTQKAA